MFKFLYEKLTEHNMYQILSQLVRFCRLYIKKNILLFFFSSPCSTTWKSTNEWQFRDTLLLVSIMHSILGPTFFSVSLSHKIIRSLSSFEKNAWLAWMFNRMVSIRDRLHYSSMSSILLTVIDHPSSISRKDEHTCICYSSKLFISL